MKLIIEMQDEQCSLQVEGEPSLNSVLRALGAVALHGLNSAIETVDEEHKEAASYGLYDQANAIFSSVLQDFIPDHELRPDLTAEAIFQKEKEIIAKHAATTDN